MRVRFHRLLLVLTIVLVMGAGAACTREADKVDDGRLEVMVSIVPQQYLLERLGGEHVRVSVMVEPGASPATYEPKPEQLKALSKAVAYFSIGVAFESVWLNKIAEANKEMIIVDTIAHVERLAMTEQHDDDEEHAEGALDPHVWLSPELVKVQSETICEALAQLDPAHENAYRANLRAFLADIEALEQEIRATLSGLQNKKFMVFHPSWGYFARDFGLEQISVEVGGQEPSAQEMAQLIREAQDAGIRVVFAQPEFSTQDAQTIAQEIGGEVLLVSPLAPDWLENMRQVAQTFAEVLNR